MVLNLGILKILFPLPTRDDQWVAEPFEVEQIIKPIKTAGMKIKIPIKKAKIIFVVLFTLIFKTLMWD